MRAILMILLLVPALIQPVRASEFTAPEPPGTAQALLPDETSDFGSDLWYVVCSALRTVHPSFTEAIRTCTALLAASVLICLVSDISVNVKAVINLVGTVTIGIILFSPMRSLIQLGVETVQQISQYGRLLLPVMTGALAAQGQVTKSGALYTATAVFDTLLTTGVAKLLLPLVYVYLALCFAANLFDQPLIQQMQKFMKWLMAWGLKIVLYVFTGYIGITGVVGGTTDAALLKVTKLTISGMVPVVGNILSDASEAVLVSVGIMKNVAGVYGLLAIIAMWIGPFFQIGVQYLILKVTSGIIEMFGTKSMAGLTKDFSTAMGLVLAMTGTVCLIFLISTICYMKGGS